MSARTLASTALRESAPHIVTLAALTILLKSLSIGLALGVALIVVLTRLRREAPTFLGQFIFMLGGAAMAYALGRTLDGHVQVEFAAMFLGGAIARLAIARPIFGRAVDVTMLTFSFVAIGASRDPPRILYVGAGALFTMTALLFLSEAPQGRIFRARAPSAIFGVLLAVGIAGALAWGTPKLTGRGGYNIMRGFGQKTGFSGRVRLGDPGELQTSDEIVMRIRGGKTDYLRGAVLDVFAEDSWSSEQRKPIRFSGGAPGPLTVEMVKPTTYLFSPHGGEARADGAGVDAYGATTVPVAISEFTIEPVGALPDTEPSRRDLWVTPWLRERLEPLANEIVGDEKDPEKALRLIEKYLETHYRYTLSRHTKKEYRSALLDFLFSSKEGHCEFFASAMALLARAHGIPSRVIAGYRVVETNKYGGYAVVRDKHAHSWVEAWVPARHTFVTFDPTPRVEAMQELESDSAASFADAARVRVADFAATLGQKPGRLLGALAVLIVLYLGRGAFPRLFRRRAKTDSTDEARPYFLALALELRDAGLGRDPWEGVETYARRVEERGEDEAATLLRRYAAHRYGGAEDDATLQRAFQKRRKIRLASLPSAEGLTKKRTTA
jgi:transglutaminase-like putative cysteine protease